MRVRDTQIVIKTKHHQTLDNKILVSVFALNKNYQPKVLESFSTYPYINKDWGELCVLFVKYKDRTYPLHFNGRRKWYIDLSEQSRCV